MWRTPWGDTAPWSADVAHANQLRIIGWTVDTHDWRGDTAEQMLARDEATSSDDGAIVLAHDGIGPGARRADARETIAYVALVAELRRREPVSSWGCWRDRLERDDVTESR